MTIKITAIGTIYDVCVYMCVCVCVYMCVYVRVCICVCVCVYMYVCVYMCVYVLFLIHIYSADYMQFVDLGCSWFFIDKIDAHFVTCQTTSLHVSQSILS